MNFCSECDNMLYPKEDRKNKVLLLACRNCQWETIADNNCIYTNDLKTGTVEGALS